MEDLTPWRILLKKSGQIEVIGYALPQVELYDFAGAERCREKIPFDIVLRNVCVVKMKTSIVIFTHWH